MMKMFAYQRIMIFATFFSALSLLSLQFTNAQTLRASSCDGHWYAYTHAGNSYGEGWHSHSKRKAKEFAIISCKEYATSDMESKCEENVQVECHDGKQRRASSCDGSWYAYTRAGNAYGEGWHSHNKSKAEDIAIGECEAYATSSDDDKCEENVQVECQEDGQRRTSSCDGDWYAYTHAGNAYGEGWHSNSKSEAEEIAISNCEEYATSTMEGKCEENVQAECQD